MEGWKGGECREDGAWGCTGSRRKQRVGHQGTAAGGRRLYGRAGRDGHVAEARRDDAGGRMEPGGLRRRGAQVESPGHIEITRTGQSVSKRGGPGHAPPRASLLGFHPPCDCMLAAIEGLGSPVLCVSAASSTLPPSEPSFFHVLSPASPALHHPSLFRPPLCPQPRGEMACTGQRSHHRKWPRERPVHLM
jgi:hypothetical protein